MASRLSSLLVRDGLVGVKRMEKAFQRQVIYGGGLDTILLEMNLVPEDRLSQYLALASGLPPATRGEINVFDAEAIRICPESTALRHRVVPLAVEDGALRVLVHDPVDMGLLEDLADAVDLPVQPLIVPEYRWHIVFARAFGATAPGRFANLATVADAAPVTAPVGRARTVIVDGDEEDGADHEIVDVKPEGARPVTPPPSTAVPLVPVAPDAVTMRLDTVLPFDTSELPERIIPADEITPPQVPRVRTASQPLGRIEPREAVPQEVDRTAEFESGGRHADVEMPRTRTLPGMPPATTASRPVTIAPEPSAPEPVAADEISTPSEVPLPRMPTAPPQGPPPVAGTGRIVRPGTGGRIPTAREIEVPPGDGPITPVTAREALSTASERDEIFTLLLRAIRSRARWTGLLTVQGGAAIGRLAIAEPGLDTDAVASVLIPLDVASAFRTSILERRHHIGPVATGAADVDDMIARMGGAVPPSALLLSIVLRERTVAIAIGHRVDRGIGLGDVAELLPLAQVAADAVGRLIVRHKSLGYRAPTADPAPPVEIEVEDVPTKRVGRNTGNWSVPQEVVVAPVVDQPSEVVHLVAEPPRPIAEVLRDVEEGDATDAGHALEEAIARAGEVLPVLGDRFPGKLRIDRYQVSGRPLRAAQYGGLLELIVRIGPPAADLLVEKMADAHKDVRFYATVCAAEMRPRNALYALVERLFDADYGVRTCAIEGLTGFPVRDLDLALVRARHALHSEDPERVMAAAAAVAALGDVQSIPDLVDTVGRPGKRGEHARRALVALTKQDFGSSERRWRRWWEDHRKMHRIEWMIEGLGHKEAPIRQSAADDLRTLTGEHFGYHHDLPRRDRDAAQMRWRMWWNETGHARFMKDDDERMRPTALLPLRRE